MMFFPIFSSKKSWNSRWAHSSRVVKTSIACCWKKKWNEIFDHRDKRGEDGSQSTQVRKEMMNGRSGSLLHGNSITLQFAFFNNNSLNTHIFDDSFTLLSFKVVTQAPSDTTLMVIYLIFITKKKICVSWTWTITVVCTTDINVVRVASPQNRWCWKKRAAITEKKMK